MARITLDAISKRYRDGTRALEPTDLCIEDGEHFVLVGPSGCGKSTLLNIIVGLIEPSSGEVRVDDVPVTRLDPKDRNMAMVFQDYAVYPHMSVAGNIAFPLTLARLPKAEIAQRVSQVAALLGLESLLDRKPSELSGGQRQRVAMGRAIVRRPVAFLLDEPLSNLDATLRGQMRVELARLQRQLGVTTIHVTHDQTEAMTLGHRIAVMREGRVQQIATPREVYELPANLFVAGFIGSPGMNLLPGRSSGDRLELPIGTLTVPEDWPLADRHPRVIAGLRPEHLILAGDSGNPANTLGFEAEVELVEWLGAESFVHLRIASPLPGQGGFTTTGWPDGAEPAPDGLLRLIARVDARGRGFEAERVRCTVDVRSLCLFDPESGDRIWPTPPVARDLHLQLGGRG